MLYNPRAKTTRAVCQLLYLALLILLVITTFWPARNPEVSLVMVLTIKLLPLLVFAPIVLRGDNRGLIWLSFVIIFYFTQFTVSAWLTEGAPGATVNAVVALLLFVFAMIHLKVNRPAA